MKKFALFIITVIFIYGCGKKEVDYEVYNPQAFVFYLSDGWELNGTVRVKGFEQKKEGNDQKAFLSLDVHLITPAGDTLYSVAGGYEEKTHHEKFIDVGFEIQLELDSTFSLGDYTLIYNVTDELGKESGSAFANFSLKEE